jgi:hypothetical protein
VPDVALRSGGVQRDGEIVSPTEKQVLSKILEGQICIEYRSDFLVTLKWREYLVR